LFARRWKNPLIFPARLCGAMEFYATKFRDFEFRAARWANRELDFKIFAKFCRAYRRQI